MTLGLELSLQLVFGKLKSTFYAHSSLINVIQTSKKKFRSAKKIVW